MKIRQDMSREADYDVDLFAEMIRSGRFSKHEEGYDLSEKPENAPNNEKKSKT